MNALEMLTVFSGQFNSMMVRARERCFDISGSERLLGYRESATMYRELGDELSTLAMWAAVEEERIKKEKEDQDPYADEDVYPDCLGGVPVPRSVRVGL